jgi:hypothetical protein
MDPFRITGSRPQMQGCPFNRVALPSFLRNEANLAALSMLLISDTCCRIVTAKRAKWAKLMMRRNCSSDGATMALQNTATSFFTEPGLTNASVSAVGRRVRGTIGNWVRKALDPYRPELHYMRGPGPKCLQKQRLAGRRGYR